MLTDKNRNILLLEPNYKNKYPPIGLMKLATYHRMLGDNVVFYKGDLKTFVIDSLTDELLNKLDELDNTINWKKYRKLVFKYIKTGKSELFNDLVSKSKYKIIISQWLSYYKKYYRKKEYQKHPKWDRIYITTLFTFHWNITIETIEFAKTIVKDINEIKVGGVLASVLADEVTKATGIIPYKGLLDKPGIFDNNKIIIDELPLDYSILDEIDYVYPENNAYYGYMTRGCIRKCSFCAVWKIEPYFNPYISIKDKIETIKKKYGEKRNLLLLDNNVLASKQFPQIIEEIKESGFVKGAKFVEPNYLDIAIKNLKENLNDKAYIKKSFYLLQNLLKKLKGKSQQELFDLLAEYNLLNIETSTKENILAIYPKVKDLYEKQRNKIPKQRYVDFNQGIDARLITEEKMRLLSEIPIRPLRIAFDSMKYEKVYRKAVKLAAKYGIRNLSNYLLYNENDKPIELYQRLQINIELCEELDINIYSFPMKYHPINGEQYLNRDYLGKYWNRKFIRAIQTILNATKGKIGRGKSFFEKAFGKSEKEYFKILYMPEAYILHRYFFEDMGYTTIWWQEFSSFNATDKEIVKKIIESNNFNNLSELTNNKKVINFIHEHYLISRKDIKNPKSIYYQQKKEYDKMKKQSQQEDPKNHPQKISEQDFKVELILTSKPIKTTKQRYCI